MSPIGAAAVSEAALIGILEVSPIGVVILDTSGRVMFWNSRLIEMLGGLQGAEFSKAASQIFIRDPQIHRRVMAGLATGEQVFEPDVELIRGDEASTWASVTLQRLTFEGSDAALAWFYDVTAHKRALAELQASEFSLLTMLEASPVGAAVLDGDGKVMFWNSRLIDILGVHGEAFSDAASLVFNGDSSIRDRLMKALREDGFVRDAAIRAPRPGMSDLSALVSMERVTFERMPGILTWIYDVSDLRRAQEISEEATRAKSSFLATMSHEIRTPMNGVVTLAELLAETRLTSDQAAMVRTIREAGQSLITIINDILDFSKIEAGRLELERLACAPRQLVDGVAALLAPKAQEKGLEFILRIDDETPSFVTTDPSRLRQILLNIAGNAIKFTERGFVTIDLRPIEGGLRFEVSDSGIGISAERQTTLFTAFSQADVSIGRRFGGTGLGLSISLGLLQLLGGEIGVRSAPDKGSCFWFELPAPRSAAPAESAARTEGAARQAWRAPTREAAEAARAVILCAEDNVTNRDVLARVLDRLGFVFDLHPDGEAALAAWKQRDCYGMVLTDYHMPGVDGLALARRIRAEEKRRKLDFTPIVALTADAVKGTEERCWDAGMNGYVTKPVAIDQLENIITSLLPAAMELRTPGLALDAIDGGLQQVDDAILDLTLLQELVGDDPETIQAMLGDFLDSAAQMVEGLPGLIATNRQEAHRAAHSLKSASRYTGAKALGDLAESIEKALRVDQIALAASGAERLKPNFEALARMIQTLGLGRQLNAVRMEIGRMAEPMQDATASSGLELEAVVSITEEAASKILEAAETIGAMAEKITDREQAELLQRQLSAIFEACSFQDLTSQRIRRAVARLTTIEDRLDHAMRSFKLDEESFIAADLAGGAQNQTEIDRLMAM